MKRNAWKYCALGITALLMVACHSNKSLTKADMSGARGEGTQAYALTDPANFEKDAAGRDINPMTAPANQTYYFAFDSDNMRSEDLRALNIQADYLAAHSNAKIRLEGNTDNRGSREYNIGLGWRRDQAVARLLEERGVNPNQIEMVSYGKERPAAFGNNERDWQLNRRVNLMYKVY